MDTPPLMAAREHFVVALALVVLLAAPPRAAWPADWLPQHLQARFELSSAGMVVGEAVWRLERPAPGRLRLTARTSPVAPYAWFRPDVVEEASELEVHGDALRPLRYRYARTGGKRERHTRVTFDWAAGSADMTHKGQRFDVTLADGAQDKLGYLLSVVRDAGRGQRELAYPVASGRELETYRLAVRGEDSVAGPTGDLPALRLERLGQVKRRTLLWLAPSLGHWPVRIEHTEADGTTVRLRLVELDGVRAR